ncbi:hypothetical protein Q8F55_003706 [Vanrija albida]|uniref:Trafficking protein particle complex subunit 11 domain-containing protein n=1 Tax=Vanrija albida TaxID=181172 RepID=A0ABR3Q4P4_9TREE
MNSYPPEFLSHPQPLMFIAGLPGAPAARRPSSSAAASAAVTSPTTDTHALPLQSPEKAALGLPAPDSSDEFEVLGRDLRAVLAPYTQPPRVWLPEAERRAFRVVLTDKNVRLPLRKAAPLAGETQQHSPLSPLTPSSPLHPDGLIAPVWVRKHTEFVPAVFVLFLRLYESPKGPSDSPLGDEVAAESRRQAEREADEGLVREISERRRRLGERGIKLTVVLMATTAALDSPGLDQRLSLIRRASVLSAKASLFVLTPVPSHELPDFVSSLQDALYDSALEYYAAHGKRIRRKRGRVPQSSGAASSPSLPPGGNRSRSGSVAARPLGSQGWIVRYEWKAGWFAEARGELDLARRHYEDCWNELARMFSSTTTLPPRTKRWAEAKVLADCVAIKICKLLLYEGSAAKVLIPFFVHLRRFADLSRGWGIGEETFEFWSWVARQYRILGEVLEIAQGHGFHVPPLPLPAYATPAASVVPPPSDELPIPISANNPLHVLHPPAFYFYNAACCTIERKQRFDDALSAERDSGSVALAAAPGFANEKNVDHAALIVELLSKAYNLLKDEEQEASRLALYIAFRIAKTHCQAGEHELAVRYLNLISGKFAQEGWKPVLYEIRTISYECAKQTGDVETAARLLVDILASGDATDGEALQDDLLSLLKTTTAPSPEPIAVDGSDDSLLDARVGFREEKVGVGSSVAFQVAISPRPKVDVSRLEFSQLRIGFSDGRPDVVVASGGESQYVDVGTVKPQGESEAFKAPLKWANGDTLVVTGELPGNVATEVEISDITLVLTAGTWTLDLRLVPQQLVVWTVKDGASYLPVSKLSSSVVFSQLPHGLTLDVTHVPVAFVGESLPVKVKIASTDSRKLKLSLSVLLQPGAEPDGSTITVGDTQSDALVKEVSLGTIEQGGEVEKDVTLIVPAEGTKLLDFNVLSEVEGTVADTAETAKTAVVPVVAPFTCTATVHTTGPATAGSTGFGVISALLTVPGPRGVVVDKVEVVADAENTKLLGSSLDVATFPQTWSHTTSFAFSARFSVGTPAHRLAAQPPSAASAHISWHAADDTSAETLSTVVPLPALVPPVPDAFITSSLSFPPVVRAHEPFPVSLELRNAHPTEAAWVALQGETADGFVWAGPRGARVGPVPAGGRSVVTVEAMAVGAPGWQALPGLGAWAGDGNERRQVGVATQGDRPGATVLVRP